MEIVAPAMPAPMRAINRPARLCIDRGHAEQGVKHDAAGQTQQQHRPPADAVGEPPPERRKQKLHGRETGHQQPQRRERGVELLAINRQQRQHHAETEQVDKHGQENDQQRTATRTFNHDRRVRLGGWRDCRASRHNIVPAMSLLEACGSLPPRLGVAWRWPRCAGSGCVVSERAGTLEFDDASHHLSRASSTRVALGRRPGPAPAPAA